MKSRKFYTVFGGVAAVGLALALGLVFGVFRNESGPVKDGAPLPQAAAATVAGLADTGPGRGGGSSEGIKVHGHWTIEVRETDGRLVSRTEFENALGLDGAAVLRSVLARTNSFGFWQISLSSTTSTQPCAPSFCTIGEPNDTDTVIGFRTLSVSTQVNTVVLTGQATASATTSIGRVATGAGLCQSNVAPSSPCSSISKFGFTLKDLASPQNVTPGQQVSVTVVISFS